MTKVKPIKDFMDRMERLMLGIRDVKDIVNSLHVFMQYHIRTIENAITTHTEELDAQSIMDLYFQQGRFMELKYVLEYIQRRMYIDTVKHDKTKLIQLCESLQNVMKDMDALNRSTAPLYACDRRDELYNFIYRSKKRISEVISLLKEN